MIGFMTPMMMGQGSNSPITTWSATDKSPNWSVSTDLRTATRAGGSSYTAVRGTSYAASGRRYIEYNVLAMANTLLIGLADSTFSATATGAPGNAANGIRYNFSGDILYNGQIQSGGRANFGAGSCVGLALDKGAGTIDWFVNGNFQYRSTEIPASALAPIISSNDGNVTSVKLNCGQDPFLYGPPTGFSPWG